MNELGSIVNELMGHNMCNPMREPLGNPYKDFILITNNGDTKKIEVLVAGVNKEEIEVVVYKNILTIDINESSLFVPESSHGVDCSEYDTSTIKTEIENGILTITLKKKEEFKPKKIKL